MLELLFSDYRPYMQDALAWILCCAALVWGGGPERIVAATWLILFELGTMLYKVIFGEMRQLETVDWYFASIDLVAATIWISVALYANRNYTLWIAAMQLLAVTAHLSRGMVEVISPVTYAAMVIAPGWLQLLFLALGVSRHIARKRRFGDYRDWRLASLNSTLTGAVVGSGGGSAPWQRGRQPSWRDDLK